MTRHLDNAKSVQAQLNEMRELDARLKLLKDELKTYMDENDIEVLKGETTCFKKIWVKDTLIFDSTKFKEEHADLYAEYKTKEKAGYYKYEEGVLK
jgi:hypothetical protein